MGGIGTDVDHLVQMKRTADRLLGDAYEWSVLGAGRYQMGVVTAAAIMGAHVRVGLEDSLYLGKGQLAKSNADQVRQYPRDPRGALARDRDARRGPRDPVPQGS